LTITLIFVIIVTMAYRFGNTASEDSKERVKIMTAAQAEGSLPPEIVEEIRELRLHALDAWRQCVSEGLTCSSFAEFLVEFLAEGVAGNRSPVLQQDTALAEWGTRVSEWGYEGSLRDYIAANCWCNHGELHGVTGQDVIVRSPCPMHPPST
jgi:hypothetical protein